MIDFEKEKALRTQQAQQVVMKYLPKVQGLDRTLIEAMNYSVEAGGKRLRPMMIRLTYEMLGGRGTVVEPFMAAMEMIHTHSLIHDDLPAMDNDQYRRGKKTTHVIYGEAMAILAGDGLLNYAYETACRAFDMLESAEHEGTRVPVSDGSVPVTGGYRTTAADVGRALQILSEKTGVTGMIGGQSLDVELDGQPLSRDQLDYIYDLKTGALIEGSLMIGAALAGADEQILGKLGMIGRRIGVAFQIQDDILDVAGDEKLIGKPVHSDEKNHKTTYVTLYGMEKSEADVKKLTDSAVCVLDTLPGEHAFLRQLMLSLVGRTS